MPLKFRGALSKQAEPALSVTDSPGGVEPISIRILQGATSTTSVSTNFETDYRPWSEGCQLGDSGPVGIERAAHGLKHHGFLSEKIGDEAGTVMVIDAEDLKDAGV